MKRKFNCKFNFSAGGTSGDEVVKLWGDNQSLQKESAQKNEGFNVRENCTFQLDSAAYGKSTEEQVKDAVENYLNQEKEKEAFLNFLNQSVVKNFKPETSSVNKESEPESTKEENVSTSFSSYCND